MSETPMSPERLTEIRAELEHVTQLAAEARGWRLEDYQAVRGALHSARLLATEVAARPSRAEVLGEAADVVECFDYPSAGALDEPGVLEQVELAERVQRALAAALRAMADEAGKDTPAGGDSTPHGGFFQPGRTYRSPHTGFTAPELISTFRVEHVTRHPDRGHLRAIGWIRTGEPGSGWHGDFRDEDEADGWTEVTEGCDAAKGDPAAASNAGSTSTT